MRWAKTG